MAMTEVEKWMAMVAAARLLPLLYDVVISVSPSSS
jgi:hypothetical protein